MMAETTVKHKVRKPMEELPHDATCEDVIERLYNRSAADRAFPHSRDYARRR
jgi:hypothetical protein